MWPSVSMHSKFSGLMIRVGHIKTHNLVSHSLLYASWENRGGNKWVEMWLKFACFGLKTACDRHCRGVQRSQMINPSNPTTPTNIPSLIAGYQRLRTSVELPQGGLINPMSISYNPVSMYRLLRAMPDGGIYDSESSLSPQPSPGEPPSPVLL